MDFGTNKLDYVIPAQAGIQLNVKIRLFHPIGQDCDSFAAINIVTGSPIEDGNDNLSEFTPSGKVE